MAEFPCIISESHYILRKAKYLAFRPSSLMLPLRHNILVLFMFFRVSPADFPSLDMVVGARQQKANIILRALVRSLFKIVSLRRFCASADIMF